MVTVVDARSIPFSLTLPSISTANNEGLEVLDLNWNHLRMKGAVAFCAGLKVWFYKKLISSLTGYIPYSIAYIFHV